MCWKCRQRDVAERVGRWRGARYVDKSKHMFDKRLGNGAVYEVEEKGGGSEKGKRKEWIGKSGI